MKRISFVLVLLVGLMVPRAKGEDAATEEKLNQLTGKVEDLLAGLEAERKRVAELAREIDSLREQQGKPNGSYASQEELKRLAEKLQEVDKNREHDKDLILKEITKLGKAVSTPATARTQKSNSAPASDTTNTGSDSKPTKPEKTEKGYEYVIKAGDTYSVIAQAYREQGIKITPEQIEKANPGVNPTRLKVGQKIFIPSPPS